MAFFLLVFFFFFLFVCLFVCLFFAVVFFLCIILIQIKFFLIFPQKYMLWVYSLVEKSISLYLP